jgi:nicotinamide riboside transporter PnuC
MYIIIIFCLLGQILVTKNKRNGYLIWIICDGILAVFNFSQYKLPGALPQGILWTLYFFVSLWGYIIYKKEDNRFCDSYYR